MTIVYRLERKNKTINSETIVGIGPYVSDYTQTGQILSGYAGADNTHPCPDDDMRIARELANRDTDFYKLKEYVCGFETLEDMLRWFHLLKDEEVASKFKDIFHVVTYVSEDAIHGSFQTVFNMYTCKVVECTALSNFYE